MRDKVKLLAAAWTTEAGIMLITDYLYCNFTVLLVTSEQPGNALVILSFIDIFSTQPFSAKVHTYYYAIKTYSSLK